MDKTSIKPICLNCEHCPCAWLIEAVREHEAPISAASGACERWELADVFRQHWPEEEALPGEPSAIMPVAELAEAQYARGWRDGFLEAKKHRPEEGA